MNYQIRNAKSTDEKDIIGCWRESFSDSEEFILEMLYKADLIHSATVAVSSGKVCSVMFAFDGQQLCQKNCSYLYALCTHPEFRHYGLGTAVCNARIKASLENGNDFIFLSPANKSLYNWYRKAFQMRDVYAFERKNIKEKVGEIGKIISLDVKSFMCLRQNNESIFSEQLLQAQEIIYRHYNGGFFRLEFNNGYAVASTYQENGIIWIQELFCSKCSQADALTTIADFYGLSYESCRFSYQNPLQILAKSSLDESPLEFNFSFPYHLS